MVNNFITNQTNKTKKQNYVISFSNVSQMLLKLSNNTSLEIHVLATKIKDASTFVRMSGCIINNLYLRHVVYAKSF